MTTRRRHVGVSETIRYGYALGRVRALEAKLLAESTYRRLLATPILGEQKRVLSDTAYGGILDNAVTADDVEAAFSKELLAVYADILEGSRVPEPIQRYFAVEIELEEERLALKRAARGSDESEQSGVRALGVAPAAGDAPIADVDAYIDGKRLVALRDAARDSGLDLLADLVERMIDHANLKVVVRAMLGARGLTPAGRERAASALVDGGTVTVARYRDLLFAPALDAEALRAALPWTRSLDAAELLDRSMLDVALKRREAAALRSAATTPTGADPVIVYVLRRRIEIETLRSLIVATLAGAHVDRLERRIVVVG